MNLEGAKILCLAPHADDIEFGMGGTLARFQPDAHVVVFSERVGERNGIKHDDRNNQIRSMAIAGLEPSRVHWVEKTIPLRMFDLYREYIREAVQAHVNAFSPDIIFCPAVTETMQDHRAIGEEVVRVQRGHADVIGYEVPRHNRGFEPNAFVMLEEAHVARKCGMLACWPEFQDRYYFAMDVVRSQAVTRAADAGLPGLAEAFHIYRVTR